MASRLEALVVDAADPAALARWWAEALGWVVTAQEPGEVAVARVRSPGWCWPTPKATSSACSPPARRRHDRPDRPRPRPGPGPGGRGSVMLFKAVAATTGGAFSLHERRLPPGGRRPPPHRHTDCQEAFYVLEGEVEFTLGTETVRRGPGTFVLVPGGVAHTFGNAGSAPPA